MEKLNGTRLDWWATARALRGQTASGDRHLVHEFASGALLAVVDGLGHGPEAASAAEVAIRILRDNARDPLVTLMQRCHQALYRTRGVVMSVASLNAGTGTMAWIGVGNVEVLALGAGLKAERTRERLLLRRGVVGISALPPLHTATIPVRAGDTFIFVTDGIAQNFDEGIDPAQPPKALADGILARHGRDTDDALVLVARLAAV
jgi:serine phosphatase RsbU (regulator of sigma subunit)